MTMIKNYWAFTSKGYKWIMLFLVPFIVIGLNIAGEVLENKWMLLTGLLLYLFIIPSVDIMSDYWVLPGFYAKGNNSLEFLQSTTKFKRMIQDVVIVDMLRRAALHGGTFLVVYLVLMDGNNFAQTFIQGLSFMPLLSIVISQLAVFVSRFFRTWNYVFSCACVATGFLSGFVGAVNHTGTGAVNEWFLIIVIGLGIFMIALTIGVTLKKVRDSYYDK